MSVPPLDVVLHGHFYQPPREDPWTDTVPAEPTAAPFHDWNQRIHEECYRSVTAARLLASDGRVRGFLNTLTRMSFDAAPTLLRWLERETPATYGAFLDADRGGMRRTGHGNALATSYHHVILPLASPRDRRTEIRWGVRDFRRRFGRDPEGFWLPEAAVDLPTLEAVADEGLAFVVLGSSQVVEAPPRGLPGRVSLGGDRSMAVFVYDGGLSHGVSFGGLLRDASAWADALMAHRSADGPALASLATDGETFGHHHTFGEMALANVLVRLEAEPHVRVTNFAAVLAERGAEHPVEVVAPSSWSCPHGVDRWRRDCGCRTDPSVPTSQAWRGPLRRGLARLGEELARIYADAMAPLVPDPGATMDRYVEVADADLPARIDFLDREAGRSQGEGERRTALEALEMAREGLRMFTSCAWFFDDLARLEPILALRSASRALDLAGPEARTLEDELINTLRDASSNDPSEGDGAGVWARHVRSGPSAGARVAAVDAFTSHASLTRPSRVGAWRMAAADDLTEVTDTRTGARQRWTSTLDEGEERPRVRALRDKVGGAVPESPELVAAKDLPFPWDVRIGDSLGASTLRALLTPTQHNALLSGRWSLATARGHALIRALDALDGEDPHVEARVAELRPLLDDPELQEALPAPVQHAVWACWERFDASSRPSLQPLLEGAGLQPDEGGPS